MPLSVEVISRQTEVALLQKVIEWKPDEIIIWTKDLEENKSTELLVQYYNRLTQESLPSIVFLASFAELAARKPRRSAIMVQSYVQLVAPYKSWSVVVDEDLMKTLALSRDESENGKDEILLFYMTE